MEASKMQACMIVLREGKSRADKLIHAITILIYFNDNRQNFADFSRINYILSKYPCNTFRVL